MKRPHFFALACLFFLASLAGCNAPNFEGARKAKPSAVTAPVIGYQADPFVKRRLLRIQARETLDELTAPLAAERRKYAAAAQAIFSGVRTQPLVLSAPGTYTYPVAATVKISPADTQKGVIACAVKANNVTVEGLTIEGGWRGFSVGGVSHITFRRCTIRHCGYPKSSPGGGSNILCWNGSDLTLEDVISEDETGEHALYLAQTWAHARFRRCLFRYTLGRPVGMVQFNSQQGSGFSDVELDDCTFQGNGSPNQVCTLNGAGSVVDPIRFVRCTFVGGNRTLLLFGAGVRAGPSHALLQDCAINGPKIAIRCEDKSVVRKVGDTKVSGQISLTPGSLVQ